MASAVDRTLAAHAKARGGGEIKHIQHAAWCGDDDLAAHIQIIDLPPFGRASVHGDGAHAQSPSKELPLLRRLEDEFPRRCHHKADRRW